MESFLFLAFSEEWCNSLDLNFWFFLATETEDDSVYVEVLNSLVEQVDCLNDKGSEDDLLYSLEDLFEFIQWEVNEICPEKDGKYADGERIPSIKLSSKEVANFKNKIQEDSRYLGQVLLRQKTLKRTP